MHINVTAALVTIPKVRNHPGCLNSPETNEENVVHTHNVMFFSHEGGNYATCRKM